LAPALYPSPPPARDGWKLPPPAPPQSFAPPLDQQTRQDLAWYLETYPVQYTTEVDDERAAGIAAKLKDWGGALFRPVFADPAPAIPFGNQGTARRYAWIMPSSAVTSSVVFTSAKMRCIVLSST